MIKYKYLVIMIMSISISIPILFQKLQRKTRWQCRKDNFDWYNRKYFNLVIMKNFKISSKKYLYILLKNYFLKK